MTNEQHQLIADYLAGKHVDEAILDACQQDPDFLKHVSQLKAVDRLLVVKHQQKNEHDFVRGVTQALVAQQHNKGVFRQILHFFLHYLLVPQYRGAFASVVICGLLWLSYQAVYIPSLPVANIQKLTGIESSKTLRVNDVLTSGEFSLQQGYAELALENGVTLVLEGPIDMEFKSVDHVVLKHGNLVAKVPKQAIGFKVDTPSSEIVDLGTEFGVSVKNSGASQIHVLEGEVKVRGTKKDKFDHVFINQARAFDVHQQMQIIKSNPKKFMRTLPGDSVEQPEYLHWTFDQLESGTYPCSGSGIDAQCFAAHPKSLDGEKGPTLSNGQFGQGLYFNGEDTWLETDFPGIGEDKPRTVAFWLKVPEDFSIHNAYGILSWGLPEYQSAWQISPNPVENDGPLGRIRIGTSNAQVIGTTDVRDNRWHHVAIVLFGGEQVDLSTHVLIYIDGKLESTSNKSLAKVYTQLAHPKSKPLMLGRNLAYYAQNANYQNKFFRGWLDEVYIFNTALNEQQVKQLITQNSLR